MPSLDGQSIFGYAVSMTTADNPRASQTNTFPGLSGLETLDQGLRGRYTVVSGRLAGSSAALLATAENTMRSFNDGLSHTLVDMFGVTWYPVKLESFEPQGRVQVFTNGTYHRPYQARFLHL